MPEKIQPTRIQEIRCILNGSTSNFPTVRCAYAALIMLANVFPIAWFNQENKRDSWDIPRYPTGKRCIISIDLTPTLTSDVSRWQFFQERMIEQNVLPGWSNLPPWRFRNWVANGSCWNQFIISVWVIVGGAVVSWLVCSSPDRAVWVRALAGNIVLCSWARHLTLTVPLSTKSINGYRRIVGEPNKLRGSDLRWTSIPSRGSRNTPSRFMLQKPG